MPDRLAPQHPPESVNAARDDLFARKNDRHPDSPPLPAHTVKGMGYIPDRPSGQDMMFDPHVKAAERAGAKLRVLKSGLTVAPKTTRIRVPASVDLRAKDPVTGEQVSHLPPTIYDQGSLGSCTANAIALAYEYEQRREKGLDYTPARLPIYYWEREIEGSIAYDSGAYIRDGFTVINKIGAPDEALFPYNVGAFTQRPAQAVYDDAERHRTLTYARIPTGIQSYCKQALALATPVVFGFTVYDSFFDTGRDGVVKTPDTTRESIAGGHAVTMVGYEKLRARGIFYAIVRNSWGPNWGDGGYCYFPMTWLMSEYNADDFWVIQSLARLQLVRAAKLTKRAA
jgi:C1A family cysteine protease